VWLGLAPARSESSASLDLTTPIAVAGTTGLTFDVKGAVTVVQGEAPSRVDRREQVAWVLGGTGLGIPVGEHVLHGEPWLLRWALGAALGAAFAAWLWDLLRPR
jgi:hypothetical protein